ncbi:hypothetical protein [Embleya sp. NPDC005575]|uniref:hypothetical protein n=1 Tax=Embleya sp. NPDC005575 TaxID=3156892 RepID=UPI0033B5E724
MHDARRQVFKYGMGLVTGTGRRPRLAQHLRRGFVLCHRIDLPTGALAYAAEGALKAHLRIVGIGPALTAEQMPDGWTEPVADDALSQGQLVELLAAFAEAAT